MSDTANAAPMNTGNSYGSFEYRTYVLVTLTVVYTFNFIDRILIGVVGRPIIDEFGLSNFQFGILSGIGFALFYTLLGIPIANMSEKMNRTRIIGVCVILWSIATVLCGFTVGFITLLLARLAVGIGEAGCTPPANSLISDYYKKSARPTALGIYAMGVTAGGVLAQLGGGYLIENFTWRESFIIVGAPGVLIGLIVLLTVKEPPRGYSDAPGTKVPDKAGFKEAITEIRASRTFWIMAIGATLAAFSGYALTGLTSLYIQYEFSFSPGVAAIYYMAPIAVAGTVGAFLGGFLTEIANKRSSTAASWVPGIAFLLCVLPFIFGFTASSVLMMLLGLMLGSCLQYFYLGAQYNIAQSVVSLRSRATSIAVLLFVVNLIGYGAGPPTIGYIADYFTNQMIADGSYAGLITASCSLTDTSLTTELLTACQEAKAYGVRISCIAGAVLFGLAGVFFLLSGRTLVQEQYTQEEAV